MYMHNIYLVWVRAKSNKSTSNPFIRVVLLSLIIGIRTINSLDKFQEFKLMNLNIQDSSRNNWHRLTIIVRIWIETLNSSRAHSGDKIWEVHHFKLKSTMYSRYKWHRPSFKRFKYNISKTIENHHSILSKDTEVQILARF